MNLLAPILSSKVRAEIFRLLFGLSEQPLHLRELGRRSGFAIGTILTEMKKRVGLDLVERRKDGNRVYFRANKNHPPYTESSLWFSRPRAWWICSNRPLAIGKSSRLPYQHKGDALFGANAPVGIMTAMISDYAGIENPMLARMFERRKTGRKAIGFSISERGSIKLTG